MVPGRVRFFVRCLTKSKCLYKIKMDVRLEAILRGIGVFLSVYFTVGWGRKSKPLWDLFFMVAMIALAIVLQLKF